MRTKIVLLIITLVITISCYKSEEGNKELKNNLIKNEEIENEPEKRKYKHEITEGEYVISNIVYQIINLKYNKCLTAMKYEEGDLPESFSIVAMDLKQEISPEQLWIFEHSDKKGELYKIKNYFSGGYMYKGGGHTTLTARDVISPEEINDFDWRQMLRWELIKDDKDQYYIRNKDESHKDDKVFDVVSIYDAIHLQEPPYNIDDYEKANFLPVFTHEKKETLFEEALWLIKPIMNIDEANKKYR